MTALLETKYEVSGGIALGPAVLDAIETYGARAALAPEEAAPSYLERTLRAPHMFTLRPTGRYAGVGVEWLPGHLAGFNGVYGPQRARLMVVLPWPLKRDIEAGRYLSGAAGDLLRNTFAAHGYSLDGAYVTGAVKFRPPHPYMTEIPAAWMRECQWHLWREIELVKPDIVLACGAHALRPLAGAKAKLYTHRSVVAPVRGVNLTATADVYGLLRNGETLPGFDSDVRFIARRLSGVPEAARQPAYHYLKDARALRAALDACREAPVVAIDCEWSGASPRSGGRLCTIQFSVRPYESFVVVLWSKPGRYEFAPSGGVAVNMLRELFCRPGVRIIGQNFRADLEWLIDVGLDLTEAFASRGFDTLLAAHLLREGDDHDLMALTLRHTDMGRYDYAAQLLLDRGMTHADMPDDVLHPYAAADTDALMRIYPKLEAELWNHHLDYCDKLGIDPYEADYGPAFAETVELPYHPTMWNLFRHIVMPATAPIKEMELEGMPVDRERLAWLTETFSRRRDTLLEDIRLMVGDPAFNPNSSDQVREVLFGDPLAADWSRGPGPAGSEPPRRLRLGLRPLKAAGRRGKLWDRAVNDGEARWEDGKGWRSDCLTPSTDAETLAILADEQNCKLAALLKSYRTVNTMTKTLLAESIVDENGNDTYEKGIAAHINSDGRVRTTISQLAETGRYRSYNPPLQNLPKAREAEYARIFPGVKLPSVRSILTAPEGGIYIEADKQSAELFTLAYLANDRGFKEALAARDSRGYPLSFHTSSMVKFFRLKCSAEEAEAIIKAGGDEGKKLKAWRVATKSLNFGIPYGRGAHAICQAVKREGVTCTVDDARGWIAAYAETFPNAWSYLQECKVRAHEPGYLVNPFGRVRHFVPVDDEAARAAQEREATNFPIQSTVADSLSGDLARIQRERDRLGLATRVVLAVHDAVLLWAPFAEIRQACELLRWAMVEAPGAAVPIIGLRYGIDLEYSLRWNESIDPWYLREISDGYLDHRPKCRKCGMRIGRRSDVHYVDVNGRKTAFCDFCKKG